MKRRELIDGPGVNGWVSGITLLLAGLFCISPICVAQSATATIERVSVSSTGVESEAPCYWATMSADGQVVAFQSTSSQLVSDDSNNANDIFVHNRRTHITRLVSVSSAQHQGTVASQRARISPDGRWVAFDSASDNLVEDDHNGVVDVFLHDLETRQTIRISVGSNGEEGNGNSRRPMISRDARFVMFSSQATNLVPDDTNAVEDIFLYDRMDGSVTRISVGPGGIEANGMSLTMTVSDDGRYFSFQSEASNLVPDDTNGVVDCFLYDRVANRVERVSLNSEGKEGNAGSRRISFDRQGRFIAFDSDASNLVEDDENGVQDVFLRDRLTGTTSRISLNSQNEEANGHSRNPDVSANGRFVVFFSEASNLVPGDDNGVTDVFLRDLLRQQTYLVSAGGHGQAGSDASAYPSISSDGQAISFSSSSTDLVPGDMNGVSDVFVWERPLNEIQFAQFGNGASLVTQIVLVNRSSSHDAGAVLSINDPVGNPLVIDFEGETAGDGDVHVIPAGGLKLLQTDGSGTLVTGSVRVFSDQPIEGVIVYGGQFGLAGVGSSPSLAEGFLAPLENSAQDQIKVGIAVMNLTFYSVDLRLELLSEQGVVLESLPGVSIPPSGRVAKFLEELFPAFDLSDFKGLLRVSSTGEIAATVIQTRPGQYATLPVVPIGD